MPVKTLDHVNIRTGKLDETYAFYAELLGLVLKPVPGRTDLSRGGWLYDREQRPVVHIAGIDAAYGDANDGAPAARGSGAVHHVAFDCNGYEAMQAQLAAKGHPMRVSAVASIGLRQIFVQDPNGITVELNFRAE